MPKAAERKKRAAILRSEGERTTMINEAEGRAQAAMTDAEAKRKAVVLQAQAEAERQRLEATGLQIAIQTLATTLSQYNSSSSKEEALQIAVQFLTVIRYLETHAKFADSDSTKVLMFPSKNSLPLTYGGLKFLLEDEE